ncbi:MAG: hypothetical protein JWN21_2018 [Sphingomonas bacterium]|uniref:anti-sigma factor n=1 Tax=Sphingomonas bacterium TaxID=1895847 RepID=UPI00260882ED|nr:anti-sigma factor [Sphingomonas bacterium]MDB5696475.1 hypothetical protein [Sphingomonas bacterium]
MTDNEPDVAAAELALGVLEGPERAAAYRRVLAEPGFAAEVEWWRDQFAVLVDAVPAVEPGAHIFAAVEQRLDQPTAAPRRGWLWPSIAGLTSIAAAAMLALMVAQPEPEPVPTAPPAALSGALLAAAIAPTGAGDPLSAIFDPSAGTLRLSAATLATAGKSAELWVIGGDGVPHSLGLLRQGNVTALPIAPADRPRLAAAATLAVTIEPLGGSPSGAPTGPIVAKGTLART